MNTTFPKETVWDNTNVDFHNFQTKANVHPESVVLPLSIYLIIYLERAKTQQNQNQKQHNYPQR